MGLMNFLKKDVELFPPFMVEGDNFISIFRRGYLQFSESFSSLIISIIFINYVFFCGEQQYGDNVFRILNTIIASAITLDFIIKISIIRPLYFNRYYYGLEFTILDILSGPTSLILFIIVDIKDLRKITLPDLFILLKIFTMGRIRLLIKDVTHILYVSRYINLALFLTFYVYSYYAYRFFQDVSPKYFKNIFLSLLSMFQVLTLDSWNIQVNQSISGQYGQIWSIFFIFFIIFMFFYFINLLLGAFVSYYSNPNLRQNFDYDFEHDDKLNPDLFEEYKQTVEISKALQILGLRQDEDEKMKHQWGLGKHQKYIYIYVGLQLLLEIIMAEIKPRESMNIIYIVFEMVFGVYFSVVFFLVLWSYRRFIQKNYIGLEVEATQQRQEEQSIRLYTLIVLLIAGPIAELLDIITVSYDINTLRYGPCARVTILLAIQCVQKAIFKFVEVLPGVSHIILFVAGILFSMCLIGHQFLSDIDSLLPLPTFSTMTSTYMFLLQVITFDSWGDVARVVIREKGFLYVIYFLFLTIFVGFFLLNMLVGIMATMTQPRTQELFEQEHILQQRVNKTAVMQLKEQIDIHKQNQNEQNEDEITQLKEILDQFNNSENSNEKLFVYLGGQQFEITTKNFLIFDEDQ